MIKKETNLFRETNKLLLGVFIQTNSGLPKCFSNKG